ncbi:MAG: hypothetical protein KatS3mg034_0420 [Vicingaceae bacterium]|nr:MAG: hypothetical protein KatS3mg034_0420 [Vicingaceae bacterium]
MKNPFVLNKKNYQIIVAGIVIVVIGYILMVGGGSEDPNVFSREIFSFRRITLAPVIVLLGYFIIGVGIMKKFDQ